MSQMFSRTRARDLLVDLLYSLDLDPGELGDAPVFFCRADFGQPVGRELVQQFAAQPSALYLAAGYPFNDNFMVLSTPAFCRFFDSLFTRCVQYPVQATPRYARGWVPEAVLLQRFGEVQPLALTRSNYIPDFKTG
jgi:hypothetical protein